VKKPGKPSFFKASLLAVLITTALGTQAAGLGKLTVYSAIGQPLKAEVALTATAEELSSLTAKLASPDAFKEAGIEFMPALAGLNLSVVNPNKGQPLLKLTTERPINEPFLHFLVELNWTAGRMVREYTFLLDPPEMLQVAKAASVVSPVAPVASSLPPSQTVPAKSSPPVVQPRVIALGAAKLLAAPAAGDKYQVVRGDTLSKIARESKADSVSLDQMLVALFNSNRDAFIGNNMNRLRAGKILRLPDVAEVAKLDAGEARKLIIGQATEFNAYRRRLAAATGAAPVADAAPQQQAAGLIKPRVEEKAPPLEAKDKLEVSRTETAKPAKAVAGSHLEEDLIAREKALREASERIADLEKNIENLKQLVEIKSQMGAKLQQESQVAPAQPVEAQPAAPITEPVAPPPPPITEEAPKPAAPPLPVTPQVKRPTAPPPPPPTDFVEENPQLVFGGGALVALLLGYLGYTAWRKKKMLSAERPSEPVIAMPPAVEAATSAAVFGAASERVDNGEVSIQGDFSDGGMLTTEEKVDPVAEADVLMAYGRDRQAEDILLEGLRQDSERAAIHMKLLELYAKQENIAQFEAVANQLYTLNSGRGADWDRTAAMAQKLGLAGGLFPGVESLTGTEINQAVELPAAIEHAPQPVESAAVMVAPSQETASTKAEDAGSLDFDLDLGTTSGPVAAEVAEPAAVTSSPEEAMSLDFDFDLGIPEPSQQQPQEALAQPVTNAVADDGSVDFSFDLDLGANAQEAAVVEPEVVAASVDADDLDFDLDLGDADESAGSAVPELSALDLPAEEVVEVVAAHQMVGAGPSDLKLDFDLELGAEPAPAASVDLPEVATDIDIEVPVALDLSDISLDLDEIEVAVPDAAPSIPVVAEVLADEASLTDLPPLAAGTDVDFEMDFGGTQPAVVADAQAEVVQPTVTHERPVAAMVDLPDIDLSSDTGEVASPSFVETAADAVLGGAITPADAVLNEPDNAEVTTKLELAQAYEEMGDQEGARDLLNEVLTEGSASQQAQARIRLDQLGA